VKALEEDLRYIADYFHTCEELRGSTVLVTGATGLIGVSMIRALLAIGNIDILAFVRNENKARQILGEHNHLKLIIGDIIDPIESIDSVDYIFHCAAVTASKVMVEKPVETLMTAILGTRNILEFAIRKKVKSVVYISSMEMYGVFDGLDHEVRETDLGYIDPLKIRSNYPESKRVCENMCIAYMSEFGVPVKIARLAQTFGPGILPNESRVFAQFAKSVVTQQDIVLHTRGLSEGNYCYTRDCIIGLLILLLRGIDGEAYNISNPESHTTIVDMAKMVSEKIAEGGIKVKFDIPIDNVFGYAADTKMRLNSDKLQSLGWKPQVGLEEAYRRMIRDMKNE